MPRLTQGLPLCALLFLSLLPTLHAAAVNDTEANASRAYTIRWGEGGFSDPRSPLGKLGGGQLVLDLHPWQAPIMLSIGGEHYSNSPEPTQPFEISGLTFINLYYYQAFLSRTDMDLFVGGGGGWLEVPLGDTHPIHYLSGEHINLEAGLHWKRFRRFGFYGMVKYLHAKKIDNGQRIIDFNERILMLGVTYRFGKPQTTGNLN